MLIFIYITDKEVKKRMPNNEKSGFFDSVLTDSGYDRLYDSSDVATLVSLLVKSGVFAVPDGQLKVTAAGGLGLHVSPGAAIIDGRYYILPEEKSITVPLNTTSATKKMYVCCTLRMSNRNIEIEVREEGTNTLPVNDGSVHELILCEFDLGTGISSITNNMITDRRSDNQYCGWVRGMAELDAKLLEMIQETNAEVAANKQAATSSINNLSNTVSANKTSAESAIDTLNTKLNNTRNYVKNIYVAKYQVTIQDGALNVGMSRSFSIPQTLGTDDGSVNLSLLFVTERYHSALTKWVSGDFSVTVKNDTTSAANVTMLEIGMLKAKKVF